MTEEDRVLLDVDYGGFVPRKKKKAARVQVERDGFSSSYWYPESKY
jgi:hypothetical protein